MSFFPARQVFDGNTNVFQNIPMESLRATGSYAPPNPEFDNSAQSALQTALASGTPFTWSNGGGSAGAYGIVFINCNSAVMTLAATASVTWGGVEMTPMGSAYRSANPADGWGWVFALDGIPGGAQTISVTLTQSGKTFTGFASSYSYTNVVSVGSLQIATGSSTSPALTVTAENDTDIVWGAISGGAFSPSSFSLTPREIGTSVPYFGAGDTTGTATVSATQPSSVWAVFGLDLIAFSATSGGVGLPVAIGGTGVSTITGLVMGNGTSPMTAATAGTDYVAPGGALGTPSSGNLGSCTFPTFNQSTSGNAATATKLATARNINGVAFDGSADITVADSTKTPNLVPIAVKTSAYTAAVNDFVPVNAASAGVTITLPTAPADLSRISIKKLDTSANAVTVNAGGSDVFNTSGGPTSGSLTLQNQAMVLQYSSASAIWYVISTDVPLGQLDARYEPLEQFAITTSPYTLTNAVGGQKLLNTTTNGAVTLQPDVYFFECGFSLTGMSSTSGTFSFGFAGSATLTQSWLAITEKGVTQAAPAFIAWATSSFATLQSTASVNTQGNALIRGWLVVTAAGTVIPQVSLSQAAAAVVGAGAYFRIQSVNSTASFAGAWS